MGQPITVTVRAGSRPDVRFFDTNRSLTGMAIAAVLAAAQMANGTSTTNVEPRPGSESTEMRPFMRSTSSLLM